MKRGPVLCLLLAACSTAAPRAEVQESAEPPSVTLSFAWQPGLQASVSSTRTRVRLAEKRTSRSAKSQYTLRVDAEGGQLRIHFADPSFEVDGDLGRVPASTRAQIVAQVADLMPDYVVTTTGEFVGIHDLPAFQDRLRAFLTDIFPKDLDSSMLTQIQTLLSSEAFLNGRAAEQWNAMVGTWVGAELELGATYTHQGREPVPAFPGEQILMHYSFSALQRVPCRRGDLDRDCAELEIRSVADPEDSKRMIQSFLTKLAGKALPHVPIFRTLEIENVIRVITEPEGLVPHGYSMTKTVRGSIALGDREQRVEQVDETRVSYTYP